MLIKVIGIAVNQKPIKILFGIFHIKRISFLTDKKDFGLFIDDQLSIPQIDWNSW